MTSFRRRLRGSEPPAELHRIGSKYRLIEETHHRRSLRLLSQSVRLGHRSGRRPSTLRLISKRSHRGFFFDLDHVTGHRVYLSKAITLFRSVTPYAINIANKINQDAFVTGRRKPPSQRQINGCSRCAEPGFEQVVTASSDRHGQITAFIVSEIGARGVFKRI